MGSFQKYMLWSIRATRGFHSHEWDENASRGSTQTRGVQPETWADAEVEIMDGCDIKQGRAATNDATGSRAANATGNSTGDAATEEATMRRLGDSIDCYTAKGASTLPTAKKTDANDKAYDLNQKSSQALDALAKEYVDFEATMASVTKRA